MQTLDKLQYFVGKVCTILTPPSARLYTDQQHANCFVGLVESIDEMGVWIEQLTTGKKSFFAAPLVGIIEETYRELSDEEIEKAEAILESPQVRGASNLIDPDELTRDWKRFKESNK